MPVLKAQKIKQLIFSSDTKKKAAESAAFFLVLFNELLDLLFFSFIAAISNTRKEAISHTGESNQPD